MGEKHRHIIFGRGLRTARLAAIGPCCKEVPARAAAGLRVGGNDLHAGVDEVVPILDVLGIALADEEYNGGCVWRAIVWQAALPLPGQRFGFGRSEVHTSELQSLMRILYSVLCLNKKQ